MVTAKLFRSGQSQAVQLPKDFCFPGDAVRIRRHGNAVILEPIPTTWSWLDNIVGALDNDLVQAVNEAPGQQERSKLNRLFR